MGSDEASRKPEVVRAGSDHATRMSRWHCQTAPERWIHPSKSGLFVRREPCSRGGSCAQRSRPSRRSLSSSISDPQRRAAERPRAWTTPVTTLARAARATRAGKVTAAGSAMAATRSVRNVRQARQRSERAAGPPISPASTAAPAHTSAAPRSSTATIKDRERARGPGSRRARTASAPRRKTPSLAPHLSARSPPGRRVRWLHPEVEPASTPTACASALLAPKPTGAARTISGAARPGLRLPPRAPLRVRGQEARAPWKARAATTEPCAPRSASTSLI